MCGILAVVGRPGHLLAVPATIGPLEEGYWHTSNSQPFIDRHLARFTLDACDENKLEHQHTIHQLHQEIVKVKANPKLSGEAKLERRAQIEAEIAALIGESFESNKASDIDVISQLVDSVACRGPDLLNYYVVSPHIHAFSSVLSLRQPLVGQPVVVEDFVIQFNGELYNSECLDGNDTRFFADTLQTNLGKGRNQAVVDTINQLDGEFAFVVTDKASQVVYFGRDPVGKRSLVYQYQDGTLIVASVGTGTGFTEVKNEIIKFDIATAETEIIAYNPRISSGSPDSLITVLSQAVKVRQDTILRPPNHDQGPKMAVLFSGGLDCTVLASMLCQNLNPGEPLDLITVGFDNPRTQQSAASSPDRVLAIKSWEQLQRLFPEVDLRLVQVDVPYRQWMLHKKRVAELMAPTATAMDLSIAIAFYFASSNKLSGANTSMTQSRETTEVISPYNSTAPVLFSGLGADELFGGYSRHEALFQDLTPDSPQSQVDECYAQLTASLQHDISVIHARNLGRDDRVIGSWGKELRYPYLDPAVIDFVQQMPAHTKFHFTFVEKTSKKQGTRIVMEPIRKHALRELAREMKLDWVADEPKRAIQFGAKSAKLEVGESQAKGTDRI
ncbi:hypothetical protein DICA1_E16292 [Diutina catenulata]